MFSYHLSQVFWSESKISLTDAFADILKDIFQANLGASQDTVS